jgi:magnesium chelatase family protein
MEASRVHSAAGVTLGGLVTRPPYRAPHHSATMVALVGGGSESMRPGEVSLASGGVLFLDELGEFPPAVLDALRQPLEEGVIRVSRARFTANLPARVLLVAAMNPCPCGEAGRPGACRCPEWLLTTYLSTGRLSARGLTRVRRVALTIADLADHRGPLRAFHVSAAMALRVDVTGTRGLAA